MSHPKAHFIWEALYQKETPSPLVTTDAPQQVARIGC